MNQLPERYRHRLMLTRTLQTAGSGMRRKATAAEGEWSAQYFGIPLAISLLGLFAGYQSGASLVPIAATVVPLLFGLLTVFAVANAKSWSVALLIVVFCLAFRQGFDIGEDVDPAFPWPKVAEKLGNPFLSDAEQTELHLLELKLRKNVVSGRVHNRSLHHWLRICRDTCDCCASRIAEYRTAVPE